MEEIETPPDAPAEGPQPVISGPPQPLPSLAPPAVEAVNPRHDRIALAILALLATITFADVLLGINNFYMRDLTRYYYPTKQILRDIVLNGEFPYWNPSFHAGQPIAANPEHEVFYPLTWLILLPSYDLGYRLHILVHIYIALLGMYALLRSMELRPPAAFAGALVFGLGGLTLSYINLLPILFCAAWLPLTCLFTRRFLLRPNVRDFALAGLFFGLQFLVGEPTTIMQTGFLLGMYALYRGWYSRRRLTGSMEKVGWIALITIAGLLVGAAQIAPAIDHVGDSTRSRNFTFDLVGSWSMPWAKFAEVLFPNILGHISIDRVMWYWGGGLYPSMGSPFLFNIYSSLLIVALAVGAAFVRPRGGRFVILLVLFSSALALGSHTPLLRLLYDAGVATSIRYPEKFIMVAVFAVIIFAAQMLDRMLGGDEDLREAALGFAAAAGLAALAMAILAFTPYYPKLFMKMWNAAAGAGTNRMIDLSRVDWIVAAVRGAMVVGLLATARTRFKTAWLGAGAVFLAADLTWVHHESNPRMPRRFFDPPPVASTFPADRASFRIFHEADWYGNEAMARRFFSTGDAVYWVVRNGLFPQTPVSADLRMVLERDYDKTSLLPTVDLTDSVWDVKRSGRVDWYEPFMAMSNAWYRATYRDFEVEKKRTKGDFKKSTPIHFMPTERHPRYYFADQLVTIKDRADFVKKLSRESFSRRVAFVHRKSFVPARGVVHSARERANAATLDVESIGSPGFLVMSVTPHKYWRITIDGKPVAAEITNIGYQGIVVPPGRHRIVMVYRNDIIPVAGAVSGAATITLLFFALRRPRRGPIEDAA